MENFITGHLLCQDVDVYCGGNDKFNGKVVGCADGVLTLETEPEVLTHVAVDKIISVWPRSNQASPEKKPSRSLRASK